MSKTNEKRSYVLSISQHNRMDANSIIEGEDFHINDSQLEMIRLEMKDSNSVSISQTSNENHSIRSDSKKFNSEHNSIHSRIIKKHSIDSKSNRSQIVTKKKKSLKYKTSHSALPLARLESDAEMIKQQIMSSNTPSSRVREKFQQKDRPPVLGKKQTKRSQSAMSLLFKNKLKLNFGQKAKPAPMVPNQESKRSKHKEERPKSQRKRELHQSMESIGSISAYNHENPSTEYRHHVKTEDNRSAGWKKAEQFRQACTISTSSIIYQIFKVLGIILSFATSFSYAYYAAFLDIVEEEEKEWFDLFDRVATIFFIADLLFLTMVDEHNPQKEGYWTFKNSCFKQLKQGRLVSDVIAILPFPAILSYFFPERSFTLLYFLKVIRLYTGFSLLDYKTYKKQLINVQKMRVEKLAANKDKRDDQLEDHTKMSQIVLISKVLKISKLVIIMVCLSYFSGLVWFVFCKQIAPLFDYQTSFLTEYNFQENYTTNIQRIFSLTYYAFTTLSTVGLGDFHPKNNAERILCAFIMLFGVMITSLLMENFSQMIQELKNFNKNYDDSQRFHLFLGTLKKLNGDTPLPQSLQNQMEAYFQYKWKHDRNLAISTEDDFRLFEQLPGRVQTEIYVAFLFRHFTETYKQIFDLNQNQYDLRRQYLLVKSLSRQNTFLQKEAQIDNTRYYSKDLYDEFIVTILRLLEPIYISDGQIVQREGQELLNEIFFIMSGNLYVGYNHKKYVLELSHEDVQIPFEEDDPKYKEIKLNVMTELIQSVQDLVVADQKYRFPLKFFPGQVVGFYEVVFNQASQFQYKFRSDRHDKRKGGRNTCYFIRQRNWMKLQKQFEESIQLFNQFENNVLLNYSKQLYLPISRCRKKWLSNEIDLLSEKFGPSKKGKATIIKAIFGNQIQTQNSHVNKDRLGLLKAKTQFQESLSFRSIASKRQQETSVNFSQCSVQDRDQVIEMIAQNELTERPKVSKLLDRLVYHQMKIENQKKKSNLEDFKKVFETQASLIQYLAEDVEELVQQNFTLNYDVQLLKDQIHASTLKLRKEKENSWRVQTKIEVEKRELKMQLQKEEKENHRLNKKLYKLRVQNKLLKDLADNFSSKAISTHFTFKEQQAKEMGLVIPYPVVKSNKKKLSTQTVAGFGIQEIGMVPPQNKRTKSQKSDDILEESKEESYNADSIGSPHFKKKGGFHTQDLFTFTKELSEEKSIESIVNQRNQLTERNSVSPQIAQGGQGGVTNNLNQKVNFSNQGKSSSGNQMTAFYEMILNQVPEDQLEAYKQGFKPHLKQESQPQVPQFYHMGINEQRTIVEEEEEKEQTAKRKKEKRRTSKFNYMASSNESEEDVSSSDFKSHRHENPLLGKENSSENLAAFFEPPSMIMMAPAQKKNKSSETVSSGPLASESNLSSSQSRRRKSINSKNSSSHRSSCSNDVNQSLTSSQLAIIHKKTQRKGSRGSRKGSTPVIDSITEIQSTSPFGGQKAQAPRSGFFATMNKNQLDESASSSHSRSQDVKFSPIESPTNTLKGVNIYQDAMFSRHNREKESDQKLKQFGQASTIKESKQKQREYLMRLLTNRQSKSRSNTPSISVTSVDFTESEQASDPYMDTHGSHNNKKVGDKILDRYQPDRRVEENEQSDC